MTPLEFQKPHVDDELNSTSKPFVKDSRCIHADAANADTHFTHKIVTNAIIFDVSTDLVIGIALPASLGRQSLLLVDTVSYLSIVACAEGHVCQKEASEVLNKMVDWARTFAEAMTGPSSTKYCLESISLLGQEITVLTTGEMAEVRGWCIDNVVLAIDGEIFLASPSIVFTKSN